MKVSRQGIIELISHEAIVPMPYKDSVGVWTWGVGHTAAAGDPDPRKMPRGVESSIADVIEVFERDIVKYEDGVNRAVKVPIEQHEFDALVSFHYNTGAIARATLTKKLNRGDRRGAADSFMAWRKPPEIIERRRKEQTLFKSGQYTHDGRATVYKATPSGRVRWSTARKIDITEYLSKSPRETGNYTKYPTLSAGDIGEEVRTVQMRLGIIADGVFGPQTKRAVIDFQKENGLVADGIVGVNTWRAFRQPNV